MIGKLTKVFQKHLDKNYPDWDKRMEENTNAKPLMYDTKQPKKVGVFVKE